MANASDSMTPATPDAVGRLLARPRTRAVGERPMVRIADPRATAKVQAQALPKPQPETVTLDKIGDFLELDLRRITVWLRKGLPWIAILAMLGAIAGGAYGVLSKPSYTVTSDILIDPAGLQVLGDAAAVTAGQQPDSALLAAASKLRVMTSGNVLTRVVSDLRLSSDPEFADPAGKIDPEVAALAALRAAIKVTADEKSFVATMAVTTEDIDKSILISNAVFVAFQAELARAETDGSNQIVSGLDSRLEDLKKAVNLADAAVEDYKRANGLQSSAGELTSTLLLNQLTQQVVTAQGAVIAAQSAYDGLRAGGTGSGDAAQNATLDALRAQLATAQQKLQSQSMIYGARHPIILQAQTDVDALQAQVASESTRMIAAAKTRLDEATTALQALTAKSDSQRAAVFSDNQAQIALRELEREAKSRSAVYEAFLSRSQQLSESGNLDTSNVRVISTAVPPLARSWPPRNILMITLGAAGGLALGLVLALGLGIVSDIRGPRSEPTA
ncbi:succinoglycan biosynthesis transport protein ExoP [Devosia sp. UYZn731]|uniref:GumC family protein n=1 Tax=Devosia sp. UYZn731 TaxID=3156345 RepID=UPI003394B0F1